MLVHQLHVSLVLVACMSTRSHVLCIIVPAGTRGCMRNTVSFWMEQQVRNLSSFLKKRMSLSKTMGRYNHFYDDKYLPKISLSLSLSPFSQRINSLQEKSGYLKVLRCSVYLNFFFLNVGSVNVHIVGLIDELIKKLNKRLIDQNRDINREYVTCLALSYPFIFSSLYLTHTHTHTHTHTLSFSLFFSPSLPSSFPFSYPLFFSTSLCRQYDDISAKVYEDPENTDNLVELMQFLNKVRI